MTDSAHPRPSTSPFSSPAADTPASAAAAPAAVSGLEELVATVARLRAPGGCPWDAEQTHESLVQYLTEETHELIEAIESGSSDDLLEELGDVLYQVVFHASIAAETPGEGFDIQDVAARMTRKMVGRHPHVFGDAGEQSLEDVVAGWDDVKAAEKPHRTSVLDGIPQGMPALALADKVLGRAQKIGLLETDVPALLPIDSEAELGPILLAIVSAAKAQGLDSERALRTALRDLQNEIRSSEQGDADGSFAEQDQPWGDDASDAGIIGLPSSQP